MRVRCVRKCKHTLTDTLTYTHSLTHLHTHSLTHGNTYTYWHTYIHTLRESGTHCKTVTHCNRLERTTTRYNMCVRCVRWCMYTLNDIFTYTHSESLIHTVKLAHTVTHCNTLQHTATHCNTILHTAASFRHTHVPSEWSVGWEAFFFQLSLVTEKERIRESKKERKRQRERERGEKKQMYVCVCPLDRNCFLVLLLCVLFL